LLTSNPPCGSHPICPTCLKKRLMVEIYFSSRKSMSLVHRPIPGSWMLWMIEKAGVWQAGSEVFKTILSGFLDLPFSLPDPACRSSPAYFLRSSHWLRPWNRLHVHQHQFQKYDLCEDWCNKTNPRFFDCQLQCHDWFIQQLLYWEVLWVQWTTHAQSLVQLPTLWQSRALNFCHQDEA